MRISELSGPALKKAAEIIRARAAQCDIEDIEDTGRALIEYYAEGGAAGTYEDCSQWQNLIGAANSYTKNALSIHRALLEIGLKAGEEMKKAVTYWDTADYFALTDWAECRGLNFCPDGNINE